MRDIWRCKPVVHAIKRRLTDNWKPWPRPYERPSQLPSRTTMYVINITYTAPLDRIDDALEAHRAFLAKHFEAGVFVAAGPKLPRDGGIILAVRIERDRLDAILATDPFVVQKLAHYDVTEFKTTRLAPGLNLPIPD